MENYAPIQVPGAAPVDPDAPITIPAMPQQPVAQVPQPVADPNDVTNVYTPEGELASIPTHQVPDATRMGYRIATPEEVDAASTQEKYGSTGQQALAGLEGGLKGLAGPLATGAERALGVPAEDIEGRAKANPITHGGAELAGLAGGLATGTGEGALLSHIGEAGVAASGIGEATALAKIGSKALQGAIENSVYQSGDEASKMILGNPNQSAQTAAVDIGLAGLIGGGVGGAFGTIHPLWDAASGSKLGQQLKAFTSHLGGIDGAASSGEVAKAIDQSGLEASPLIRAAVSDSPQAREWVSELSQTDTNKSGQEVQKELENFRTHAADKTLEATGRTADEVANHSEADAGRKAMSAFTDEYNTKYAPIQKEYGEITDKFKDTPLNTGLHGTVDSPYAKGPSTADTIAESVYNMAQAKGYDAPGVGAKSVVDYTLKQLPKASTVQDLSNLMANVREMTQKDPTLWNVGSELKQAILAGQEKVLGDAISKESPQLFDRYMAVRGAYRDFRGMTDELANNLSLGRAGGPKSFLSKLAEKRSPEEFLKKLSPKGNAEILPFLSKNFPDTLEHVRNNELMQTLAPAVRAAKGDASISAKTLFTGLEKLSPETRNFILGTEAQSKLSGIQTVLGKLEDNTHNFSNSGRTIAKLMQHVPGSAVAVAGMLTGHSPLLSGVVGHLSKTLAKDAPDAVKLAMLKYMGRGQAVDASAFKNMVDFIHSSLKGETAVSRATKNIFNSSREVLPSSSLPSDSSRNRLDRHLKLLQNNQAPLQKVGGKTGYYMPEHGAATAQLAATAVNYLNDIRPKTDRANPLDAPMQPNQAQKSAFNNALDIAEQPLVTIHKMSQGTLTPVDVQHLQAMYPDLKQGLDAKLQQNMMDHVVAGKQIPYNLRGQLSLFLGQPLDSTLTSAGIMGAQPKPQQSQNQTSSGTSGKPPAKSSVEGLDKLAQMSMTPGQTRSAARAKDRG